MSLTTRISEGWLRISITICHIAVSSFFLYEGVDLIKIGAKGEWKVTADFKGIDLYVTSISPGVLVILCGMLIMCWGLPKTIKNL